MDTGINTLNRKSPETSLTESWNVIEAQDINNVSEGSDGESIEVIDEEAQQKEHIPSVKDSGDSPNIDDKEQATLEYSKVVSDRVATNVIKDRSVVPLSRDETGGINLLSACGLLALLFAVLFAGASFSVFLLKVEELAVGTLSYFSSSKTIERNENEFQELLNQIKAYKEESTDLKNLVADLNSAVLTLKKELVSQKNVDNCKPDAKENSIPLFVNKKDSLFEQILNVHTNNYSNENNSHETAMPHENYFRIIEETLFQLSNENKREDDMETIKMFSQIPKHLSVLLKFESTNHNYNEFIEIWKERLLRANEKLVTDIRQMQLKMKLHIIKSLRNTQKHFFEKLCELKYMKNPECYETFIKPYEISNGNDDKNAFSKDQECKNTPSNKKIKNDNGHNPSTAKKKQTAENRKLNFNDNNKGMQDENEQFHTYTIPTLSISRENISEKNIQTNFVPGNSHDSAKVKANQETKQNKNQKPHLNSEKSRVGNVKIDKGMKSELLKERNMAKINSFSYFSEANYDQSEKKQDDGTEVGKDPKYQEFLNHKGESSSWFLKMGKHRSKIRDSRARGDWLFERARYRRRRGFFYL